MCGIAGGIASQLSGNLLEYARQMVHSLEHRGPDGQGFRVTGNSFIGNTRLSIIDAEGGKQPFSDRSGKVSLVLNGEIYNFSELKVELESLGAQFCSRSDTEVALQAYLHWGASFVDRLNGMFAIAILDERTGKLILVRDRLGVKPLYLLRSRSGTYFSSEIKTFLSVPGFHPEPNRAALGHYLFFNYVPPPFTAFNDVTHLMPGHMLSIDLQSRAENITQYWRIPNEPETLLRSTKAIEVELHHLLRNAVKIRLRSDVPIGVFLSSGLDSSLVAAMIREQASEVRTTFSVSFAEPEYDESLLAKELSDEFGWPQIVRRVTPQDLDLWPETTWHADQPHGDISFIPFFSLSRTAARSFKVAFTGDGGDELFGGYERYRRLLTPGYSVEELARSECLLPNITEYNQLLLPEAQRLWQPEASIDVIRSVIAESSQRDSINSALYLDMRLLLPGNNLVKPDKMSMAHGLELRSPFLDYRLWELMMTLPSHMKVTSAGTRLLQRFIASEYLPSSIIERPKKMLAVPIGDWFRSASKDYLLNKVKSVNWDRMGMVCPDTLSRMALDHIGGKADYRRILRALINLDHWFGKFLDR